MPTLLALALAAEPALATKAEVIAHYRDRADGLFEPMGEPRPGEWLWSFREPGQTPSEYLRVLKAHASVKFINLTQAFQAALDRITPQQTVWGDETIR